MIRRSHDFCKGLLKAGADLTIGDSCGYNALHYAVFWSDTSFVRRLLAKNIPCDMNNNCDSVTPLQLAADVGNERLVKYLAAKGASLTSRNKAGDTPLHFAARSGKPELVRYLLEQGAEPNAKNKCGKTPMHFAGYGDNNCDIMRILLDHKADAAIMDTMGRTPLHLDANFLDQDAIKCLATTLDVNLQNDKGQTPLHFWYKGSFEFDNTYHLFDNQRLPFINSEQYADDQSVSNIIHSEIYDYFEWFWPMSPDEVQKISYEALEMLLKLGADPTIKDSLNCSVLDLCRDIEDTDIIDMLKEAAARLHPKTPRKSR